MKAEKERIKAEKKEAERLKVKKLMERFQKRYDAGKYYPARDIVGSLYDICQSHLRNRNRNKEEEKMHKKIDSLIEEYAKYFAPFISVPYKTYLEIEYKGHTIGDSDNPNRDELADILWASGQRGGAFFTLPELIDSAEVPASLKRKLLNLIKKYDRPQVILEITKRWREAHKVRDEKYETMRDKTIRKTCESICASCRTEEEAILLIKTEFGIGFHGARHLDPFVHQKIGGQEIIKGVIRGPRRNDISFNCKLKASGVV